MTHLIKINFTGGLISPGELNIILDAAALADVSDVSFGLRQVLWIEIEQEAAGLNACLAHLTQHKIFFELDADECPNMISSYPAQEVFIQRNWLSEGIYKDIFDAFTHAPRLKVNIADSAQSFTPMLTGHINWIASSQPNYWYLAIRFPKTNVVYTADFWVDTSDVARMSKKIETLVLERDLKNGDELFGLLQAQRFNTAPATAELVLPMFMLPYYEGFNRYDDKLWLGIYRRNEKFSIAFLQDVCALCLETRVGLICATSWKSIIIKNIEHDDRQHWDALLAKHQINVRHAANELNFQIEDQAPDALMLKNEIVQHLSQTDTRTFGVCLGIKTLAAGEVFCSILIAQRAEKWFGLFTRQVYDILLAEDFNPNKRTGEVFARGIARRDLAGNLRGAILQYYANRKTLAAPVVDAALTAHEGEQRSMAQCPNCLTVYDEVVGRPDLGIPARTSFAMLPSIYKCECCETPKSQFVVVDAATLFV
jgi:rubredoxin